MFDFGPKLKDFTKGSKLDMVMMMKVIGTNIQFMCVVIYLILCSGTS